MKKSLEISARVYNDDTGEYIEVRPDSDGLGLFEIRQVHSDGKTVAGRITISRGDVDLLKEALDVVIRQTKLG
jgi:hypothetical protein